MSDVDEIAKQVSCTDCVNALLHCYGAWHQFDRYYKDGAFDDCSRQRNELVLCGKLKVAGPEEKREILRELVRKEGSPTEGVIWPAKRRVVLTTPAAGAAGAAAAAPTSAATEPR